MSNQTDAVIVLDPAMQALKEFCEKNVINNFQIAKRSGLNRGIIHRYMTGQSLPNIKRFRELCQAVGFKYQIK